MDVESQIYYGMEKEVESENSSDDTSECTIENCESEGEYALETEGDSVDELESDSASQNLVHKTSSEVLQERISTLRNSMTLLRNQLKEERELWKKEVEEAINMSNATQAESGDSFGRGSDCGQFYPIKEFTVAEYEQKLALYKQALAKSEAEKRATLHRQIAISNYRRRLLEVENMCNLELLRVKQNIQFLQPLQMMTSEWNLNAANDEQVGKEVANEAPEEKQLELKTPQPQIEVFTNKLCNEMNDMFSKLTPSVINASVPHLATTSMQFKTDDFMAHSQSTIWYSTDCFPVSKF